MALPTRTDFTRRSAAHDRTPRGSADVDRCPHALVRCHGGRWARSERRGADSGRGESRTDRPADRASSDHPEARDEGDRPSRGHGSRDAARRRCSLHVLDLRRQGPGQVHPHPRGRPRRVPPRQPPRQQDAAQHRSARGHRARRRRGVLAHGARAQLGVLVQGAEPRPLCLSLRHGARWPCTSATACTV